MPQGGHPERFQDLYAKHVEAAVPGALRSPAARRHPLHPQTWGFSQASALCSDRTSPVPRESPGQAPRQGTVAPTPLVGVKVSYPLAPRGPLSGREQKESYSGGVGGYSEFVPSSFPPASKPPSPLLFTALQATVTSGQASGHHWQRRSSGCLEASALTRGTGKRDKPEKGF